MKRLNVKEIDPTKTYYAVCVGCIEEIQITGVQQPKFTYENKYGEQEGFLEDAGIEYDNESYIHSLNFVCRSREEAEQLVNSSDYKRRLQEHLDFWKYFDHWYV